MAGTRIRSADIATINRVSSDPNYFRAIIGDRETTAWESRPDWQLKAKEFAFARQKRVEIFVKRAPVAIERRHRQMDVHWTVVPDTVNATGTLVVHRRIPPATEMQDMIGARQREADAARAG